jgi:hypothetical protein
MTEQQITDYLKKYNINSKEQLAVHILELKRNTRPNVGLISELVYVLEDENSVFNSFSREKTLNSHISEVINDSQQEKISSMFLDDIIAVLTENDIKNRKIISEAFLEDPKTGTEGLFNKMGRCSPQCFCDGSCKNENKGLSTRHKSRQGETHIVGDLEGINKPPYNFSAQKTEK